jgi:hypothetical protein
MAGRGRSDDARWRVRGVSVQGYSHLRDGVECQDAHRHEFEPSTGAYVLAVADGAGSRPRSAEGATLAVGLAVAVFRDGLARDGLPGGADEWRGRLRDGVETIVRAFGETTERLGAAPSDFAATLTVAVLAPPWVGIVSLGDGIVVAGAESDGAEHGFHLVVFTPPAGEYVNETTFLSSSGALDRVTIRCLHDRGLTALLLGTDGIAPIAVKRDGRSQRANVSFVAPVVESLTSVGTDPTEVTRLLLEDRITRLSADDKTLLAAVRQ